MSSVGTCQSLRWQPRRIIFIFTFMYVCFCYSCFMIPESIPLGDSLCFAYIFSMIQLIEVAGLMRGESIRSAVLMCVTLLTGTVLPTVQILLVMEGMGERGTADIFGYVFILKEVGMHLTMKDNTTRVEGISLVHSVVAVLCWVVSEIAFRIVGGSVVFDTRAVGDAVYIARMSPHLYMALITLTRIN